MNFWVEIILYSIFICFMVSMVSSKQYWRWLRGCIMILITAWFVGIVINFFTLSALLALPYILNGMYKGVQSESSNN